MSFPSPPASASSPLWHTCAVLLTHERSFCDNSKTECFGLFLALMDAGIPVSFLDEDALTEPETLAQHRVIFVSSPNVPKKGLDGLIRWAQDGGVLATVSGAALADEYNSHTDALAKATGLRTVRRKRWYLQGEEACVAPVCSGTGACVQRACQTFAGSAGEANFSAFAVKDRLPQSAGGQTLATFDDNTPALLRLNVGKGAHMHWPWLPGVSYVYSRNAIRDVDRAQPGARGIVETRGLQALLQNATADRTSGRVASPFLLSRSRVEGSLLLAERPSAAVLGLINWRCMSRACTVVDSTVQLEVVLALPFRPTRAASAQSGDVQFTTGEACADADIQGWAGDQAQRLLASAPARRETIVCLELRLAAADFLSFE